MAIWGKKVLSVLLHWDYGDKERGESLEKVCFQETLAGLVEHAQPLWIDDYLGKPDELQDLVIESARRHRPDLIFFIPFGDQFRIDTLESLRSEFVTYAWFGDDQWRFEQFTSRYAPHFTFVSTTDPWSVPKYRSLGVEPILTQWAAQPFSPLGAMLPQPGEYEFDVSFVGLCNGFRQWFISRLERAGIKVACFGAGWPAGRVDYARMTEIFRTSRINLNTSNSVSTDIRFVFHSPRTFWNYLRAPKRVQQMKARNFEIPLAGGFQLANYVPALERYLAIGSEVAVYSTPEECIQQIEYYLANEEERREITARGQARAETEHTYRHRLENILDRIWAN